VFVRAHHVENTVVEDFPFPDGSVYVIRDIDAFISTAGAGVVSVQAYDDADCTFWQVSESVDVGGFWFQWRGRQVFYGGMHLYLTCNTLLGGGVYCDFRVSGYTLGDTVSPS
jgi:hypothetical protein